jgi:hypothetical protein
VLQILMAHEQVVERPAAGGAASAGTSDTAGRGPSVRIISGGNMWISDVSGREESCCGGRTLTLRLRNTTSVHAPSPTTYVAT